MDLAAVLDEAQFSEFVHEKIDPWACRADHLRQHLLRCFGKDLLRLARRVIVRDEAVRKRGFSRGARESFRFSHR